MLLFTSFLLQRLDMERASREAMDPNLRGKARLITEAELPSWLIKDDDEVGHVHGMCMSHGQYMHVTW